MSRSRSAARPTSRNAGPATYARESGSCRGQPGCWGLAKNRWAGERVAPNAAAAEPEAGRSYHSPGRAFPGADMGRGWTIPNHGKPTPRAPAATSEGDGTTADGNIDGGGHSANPFPPEPVARSTDA